MRPAAANSAVPGGLRNASLSAPNDESLLLSGENGLELWVDRGSFYPIGLRVPDPGGLVEYAFADWREVDPAVALPQRAEFRRDGELLSSVRLRDFEILTSIDAGLFAGAGLELPGAGGKK